MAYREVTMIEIREVVRQWLAGGQRKQIARRQKPTLDMPPASGEKETGRKKRMRRN